MDMDKDNLNNKTPEEIKNDQLINDILNAKEKSIHKEYEEIENLPEDTILKDNSKSDTHKATKNKKKKRKKLNRKRLAFGLILTGIIIIIAVLCASFLIRIGKDALGIDKLSTQIEINIPLGSTTTDIADILFENGIIEEPLVFRLFSKLQNADSLYKEGNHIVRPDMAYETIISELQKESKKDTIDVTFPEGISIFDCAQILAENGVCDANDFIKTYNSSSFDFDFEKEISDSPDKFYKMEGFLFPDTYKFYKESDPEAVAKKIFVNFDVKLNPNLIGRMGELEISFEDTIILASIVQAEAPSKSEMKNVASVFWNRLNNSEEFPKLQSDPTTKYVNEIIKPNIDVQNEEMFDAYDTYKCEGLPPGAICNPGIDAIEAVLYPSDNDYYFFCSNLETMEFFYAKTDAEHEKNLVKAGLK